MPLLRWMPGQCGSLLSVPSSRAGFRRLAPADRACELVGLGLVLGAMRSEPLRQQRGDPSEYRSPLPRDKSPRSTIDEALLELTGYQPRLSRDGKRDGRRAAMVAALDGLAPYHSIRDWRRGKCQPPQWVKALLYYKLTAPSARRESVVSKLADDLSDNKKPGS